VKAMLAKMRQFFKLEVPEPEIDPKEQLLSELQQAWREWVVAQQRINNAEPEFVEAAVLGLLAAEKRYGALLRRYKELEG